MQGLRSHTVLPTCSPCIATILLILVVSCIQARDIFAQSDVPGRSETRRILVLHSYHAGYPWTDDIQRALVEMLGTRDDIELYVEYLDLLRYPDRAYLELKTGLLEQAYAPPDSQPEIIIVSDDGAMELVMELRDDLFSEIPVVFSGINNPDPGWLSKPAVYGIRGMDDRRGIGETIRLAFDLNPAVERIAIVAGSRPSEQYQFRAAMQAIQQDIPGVEVLALNALHEADLLRELNRLNERTAVVYLSYMRTPDGRNYGHSEALQMITGNSDAMVLVTSDFLVRDGVVGGSVVSGYSQGETASRIAGQLLDSREVVPPFTETRGDTRYVFDDRALQRFRIPDSRLPDRSTLINRSPERLIGEASEQGLLDFGTRELLDQQGAVMLLIDADTGVIVAANAAAYTFYGYPRLVGENISTINTLSPEETSAEMERARLERRTYFEFQHRLFDGTVRDVAVYSSPVRIHETDMLYSVVFDITEEMALRAAEARQNRIIISVLVILLLTAGTGTFILLTLLRRARAAEDAMRRHVRDRNTLILEVQHRTKNNMQVIAGLVALQGAFEPDFGHGRAFDALSRRISAIALAHQQLIEEEHLSHINLKSYLHSVVDKSFPPGGPDETEISCYTNVPDMEILIDIAVPCGLVVNEFITSGLERARTMSTPVHMQMLAQRVDDNLLELRYTDDISTDDPPDNFGETIIKELVEHQLNGTYTRKRESASGTQVCARIALSSYKDRVHHANNRS